MDSEIVNVERHDIQPHQVTKPIQLLAAWLVGLIAIDSSFLTAAGLIKEPWWAAGALVLAAIANVPIFLICLFLLQTKFRPEMQEDSYYSKHLERRFSEQTQKIQTVSVPDLNIGGGNRIPTIPRSAAMQSQRARINRALSINNLLPRYKEIVEKIKEIGFKPGETFGSDSHPPNPPKHFVVSVGVDASVSLARNIITEIYQFGLEGIGIADDVGTDRIYIGAYSYDQGNNFLKINTEDYITIMDEYTSDETFFKTIAKYDKFNNNDK